MTKKNNKTRTVVLNSFQNLPIVLFGFCIVVAVILESSSPGSVVIKIRSRYWTETFQYDLYFYKRQTTQQVDSETSSE